MLFCRRRWPVRTGAFLDQRGSIVSSSPEDALAAVRAAHGEQQWAALTPEEQTHAVFREMRRLSLEQLSQRRTRAPVPVEDEAATASSLRCSVLVKTRASERCSWEPVVVVGGRPYCGLHDPRRWRPEANLAPSAANEPGLQGAAD
ncbi:MAG: hypothetical protein BGO51_25325 [Rhodospirillales bacterium 69-11]|nr:hypothetical protein [Rhodospirillales bacterium]OJW28202.1 MAG: hypothetical protein BGO51_25325 [Rhodospirillales bacterium 69-11]